MAAFPWDRRCQSGPAFGGPCWRACFPNTAVIHWTGGLALYGIREDLVDWMQLLDPKGEHWPIPDRPSTPEAAR